MNGATFFVNSCLIASSGFLFVSFDFNQSIRVPTFDFFRLSHLTHAKDKLTDWRTDLLTGLLTSWETSCYHHPHDRPRSDTFRTICLFVGGGVFWRKSFVCTKYLFVRVFDCFLESVFFFSYLIRFRLLTLFAHSLGSFLNAFQLCPSFRLFAFNLWLIFLVLGAIALFFFFFLVQSFYNKTFWKRWRWQNVPSQGN